MAALRFAARIEIRGINPYVLVSAARAKRLKAGWRKPLPVLVRVNGHPKAKPWRINMMPAGGGRAQGERGAGAERCARALRVLAGTKERFMARSWTKGA